MADTQDDFADHGERALVEQVIAAQHGTGEGVFQGRENEIGATLSDGAEERFEGWTGDGVDGVAEQFSRSNLAEGSRLSLESDALAI